MIFLIYIWFAYAREWAATRLLYGAGLLAGMALILVDTRFITVVFGGLYMAGVLYLNHRHDGLERRSIGAEKG